MEERGNREQDAAHLAELGSGQLHDAKGTSEKERLEGGFERESWNCPQVEEGTSKHN